MVSDEIKTATVVLDHLELELNKAKQKTASAADLGVEERTMERSYWFLVMAQREILNKLAMS